MLLVTLAVVVTARSSAATGRATAAKPTIVLVHGAWANTASWSGVIARLEAEGYTADAPSNPLHSLDGDAATIADFLHTIKGPIVLVSHSYGGAVITNAATGEPRVKALVYVDAFAPAKGEGALGRDSSEPGSALGAGPAKVFKFVPYPGAPKGDALLYVKPAPPAIQLFMARRIHAHITRVHAGHRSMIADPAAVAKVITAAARATR